MCTSMGQRAANGTNAVKCSPRSSTRSEQLGGAGRHIGVGVDLAMWVVERDADLGAAILERENLLDSR
jgi:hypothetical protein